MQVCEHKVAWAAIDAAARSTGALIGPLRAPWWAEGHVQAVTQERPKTEQRPKPSMVLGL